MESKIANPIKEYYIAYFDTLGYQALRKRLTKHLNF